MVSRRVAALLVPFLLLLPGCGGSGGWGVGAEGNLSLPSGAAGYGMFNGKKGEKVRVRATSDKEPVDVRLYLNVNGRETELGKQEKVKEATLEAAVPADGAVTLQVRNTAKGDTSVRYQMERHAGG